MEPPGGIPPDRDKISIVQQPNVNLPSPHQNTSLVGASSGSQQTNLERLSRPLAFDKMEGLVREMQDPENGVPVRQQKMFLTSIPYAFMGYDLIEWLMDRLSIEESEALNIANQLCLHGYFFPVNDTKTLVVKDDSSLYRFQTPYYWPWQHKAPDNVEYAIYLAKRSLRNKQRHGLEDYESDALSSLHKNLKGKWDFISMQAEEQVRLAKERKKGDKIVSDSQERAYWRVHRPPPGQFTPLEPCPVPSRDRQGIKPKKKSIDDWQREVDYLQKSLNRTRMKMSQACESLVLYWETFSDYDFFIQPVLPSNPWVSEDITFWQLNNSIVDIPTEKRVKRWAISIEELVSDPTGLQEFTNFLEKEYSHENIRFWIAVNKLRRSAHSQVCKKVTDIYEEFLKPGAPCEINIDGKTMEIVQKGLKNPSRFTFDAAAEHIYMLLLKKDCYPRFVRSEHYKNLLATGIQPSHKKRFFNFGGVAKKKTSTIQQPNIGLMTSAQTSSSTHGAPPPGNLTRRRGSDRSLSGSAHELAIIGGTKDSTTIVPHSHSQSNLSEIPYSVSVYRGDMPNMPNDPTYLELNWKATTDATIETLSKKKMIINQETCKSKQLLERLESTAETTNTVCPWDVDQPVETTIQLSVCPWEEPVVVVPKKIIEPLPKSKSSTTSDILDVSERMKRSCGLRQNTVDSDYSTKKLMPAHNEQRRASMTITPRATEFQLATLKEITGRPSITSSPTRFKYNNNNKLSDLSCKKSLIENTEIENILISIPPPQSSSTLQQSDEIIITDSNITDEPTTTTTTITTTKTIKVDKINNDKQLSSLISTPSIQVVVCPELETTKEEENDEDDDDNNDFQINEKHNVIKVDEQSIIIEKDEMKMNNNNKNDEIKNIICKKQEQSLSSSSTHIDDGNEQKNLVKDNELIFPITIEQQDDQEDDNEFGEQTDAYELYISDEESSITLMGCVAPAPTPAPTLAPLAEIEMDAVDDETDPKNYLVKQQQEVEEIKKKRKKRISSNDNNKKLDEKNSGESSTKVVGDEINRNPVCPWEDDDVTTSDGTFTKTYATLGYL